MENYKLKSKKNLALRAKAENMHESLNRPIENLSDLDVRKLAHELQIHEIELEMQNEELRKDQKYIADSEQKYINLFDFAPIGYLILNKEGKIKDANLKICKIVKKERAFLTNTLFNKFVAYEDRDIFYLHLQNIFNYQKSNRCNIRLKGDGLLIVQLDSEYVKETESLGYCWTSITDITEDKLAEDDLKQKEKEFRTVANISNFLINVTSEEEIYLRIPQIISDNFDFGGSSLEIYEKETGDITFVGCNGIDIGNNLPFKEEAEGTASGDVIKQRKPIQIPDIWNQSKYKFNVYKKAGFKHFSCYPLRKADSVIGTLCMASVKTIAITPHFDSILQTIADTIAQAIVRKQAEKTLKKNEKFLQRIFDGIQDGITVLDKELNIIKTNKIIEQIYSHKLPFVNQKCYEVYHGKHKRCEICPTTRAIAENTLHMCVMPLINPKGESKWLEIYAFPYDDNEGNVLGAIEYVRDITKRKKVELELEQYRLNLEDIVQKRTEELTLANNSLMESEAKYLDLYDNAPDMFLSVCAETSNIIDCNETLVKVSGFTKNEIINHPVSNLFHADCMEKGRKLFLLFRKKGEIKDYELILKCKYGRIIDISLNVSAVRDKEGKIIHSRSVWRDITKRKQAEDKIKHLASFPQLSNNTILELDASGEIVFYNDATIKTMEKLGLSGQDINILLPKDINEIVKRLDQRVELELIREVKIKELILSERIHLLPKFQLIRIYTQDITEQKKKDDRIRTLNRAIEQSPGMVLITNTDGTIEYVNSTFTETTCYNTEDIISKTPRILNSGKHPESFYKTLWETITSGNEWHGELCNRKKSGELFWEFASISAVRNNDGVITHFIKSSEDITKLKHTEEALNKAKDHLMHSEKLAAIGKLSASIAHEFNNPICGIRNTLESVAELSVGAPVDDGIIKLVKLSIAENDRMANLIRKLQDFYRPTTDIASLTNINLLIDDVLLVNNKRFKNRFITVEKHYDVDMPEISVVSDQIKQVILNIIQNADDAIPENGGTITIKTEHDNSNILLQFKDSGKGIKEEFISSIFEPFISSKLAVKGTGLGLSICHGIIKKHEGDISVESEVDKGTTFTITLPIAQRTQNE